MKKLLLCSLICLHLLNCETSKNDIDDYFRKGNIQSIIYFTSESNNRSEIFGPKNINEVEYAIDILTKNKSSEGIKFLENFYSNNDTHWEIKQSIIKSFNKNNLLFNDYELICSECFSISSYDNSVSVNKEIENMLVRYNNIKVFHYLSKIMKEKYSIYTYNRDELCTKVDVIFNSILKYHNKNEEVINWVQSSKNEFEILKLENEIDTIRSEINEISEFINKNQNFILNIYIISQISSSSLCNIYEIKKAYSNEHCLLTTVGTKYNSTGWFELRVKFMGKTKVQTVGGFTPEWNHYAEVPKKGINQIVEKKNL